MRLTGKDAINYAQANDVLLCKYSDPTEEAREDVDLCDANLIAREDARLLYIDIPEGKRFEVRIIDGDTFGAIVAVLDDAGSAKAKAEELGGAFWGGVVVVDLQEKTVDEGDRIRPLRPEDACHAA